ncbi:MAG: DUF721 domain-containing protein [Synergistales bacterium]
MSGSPRPGKRRAKDLSPIGAFLGRSLSPQAMVRLNLADLSKNWEKVVGEVLAKRSRPISVEDKILVVACESPAVAHEVQMRRDIIAEKARKGWGIPLEGVKPAVRRIPLSRAALPKKTPPPPFEPTSQEVERARGRIEGKIERDDVKSSLARLMATFRRRFGRGRD